MLLNPERSGAFRDFSGFILSVHSSAASFFTWYMEIDMFLDGAYNYIQG